MDTFKLDDNNRILQTCYKNPNYKIKHGFVENGKCIVFLSSNGVFFPDTYESLINGIVLNDYYEWEKISTSLIYKYEKIIYLRDVRKAFYVTGINSVISSIDQLIEWMKIETQGFQVDYVGASSGGYLAMILATVLDNSRVVIQAGGQCDLFSWENIIQEDYFLSSHKNETNYRKWYSTQELINNSAKVPIFTFIPQKSERDKLQFEKIKDAYNIFPILVESEVHGEGLTQEGYIALLNNLHSDSFIEWLKELSKTAGDLETHALGIVEISNMIINYVDSYNNKEGLLYGKELVIKPKSKWNVIYDPMSLSLYINSIIIYGAGKNGDFLYEKVNESNEIYMCDSDDEKLKRYDKSIKRDELCDFYKRKDAIVVVTIQNKMAALEVLDWLYQDCKVEKHRIFRFVINE